MNQKRDLSATMIGLLQRHRANYSDTDLARVAAAEACRELIWVLADTMVSGADLDRVTALVDEAVSILAAGPRGRAYTGSAEGSLNQGSDLSFVDYSPFVGPMSPLAPPIDIEVADDRIIGRVRYPLAYEGPPGHVHGGFIAAGFDEVLGFAQALSGQSGMTGRLEIRYRNPTPLRSEVVYAAGLESIDGRKVTCWGTLHDGETLCAEATGLFISMNPTKLSSLMARRTSDSATEPGLGEHRE